MATAASLSFDPGHRDVVHDVQFDYYGKKVATASSDRMVKIFEVVGNEQRLKMIELPQHDDRTSLINLALFPEQVSGLTGFYIVSKFG